MSRHRATYGDGLSDQVLRSQAQVALGIETVHSVVEQRMYISGLAKQASAHTVKRKRPQ